MKRLRRVLFIALALAATKGRSPDSDHDGLPDEVERQPLSLTDPHREDTDGDGLSDGVEVRGHTNPLDADTDGDRLPDALEDTNRNGRVDRGETNPRVADTDGDGLSDGHEDENQNGAVGHAETDPRVADTDGDGLSDGLEGAALDAGPAPTATNPRRVDTDGDGLSDGLEDANQNGRVDDGETSPVLADTDGDGVRDGVEDADGDGRQGPRESSPLVADLHPTHRNDVLGVPEPLLVDWVRALGARAGEFELNALGVLSTDGSFEVAPEVEWVPLDGLGLELEAVVKQKGFDGLKLAGQVTLLSDARAGLGHGLQVVGRWHRETGVVSVTALHLSQARLGARLSLGTMAGVELGTDGRVALAVHPTLGLRLLDRLSVVFEHTLRAGPAGLELSVMPHLRADQPHLGSLQLGLGPALAVVDGQPRVSGQLALRLTWER